MASRICLGKIRILPLKRIIPIYQVSQHSFHSGIYSSTLHRSRVLGPTLLSRCSRNGLICNSYGAVRLKSTEATDGANTVTQNLPEGYIPEPPPIPIPEADLTSVVEPALNVLGEPTLQSMGLASTWWPSSLMQWGLESLHCLDIPWWGAIVAGTICLRILIFPLVIKGQQNAANMGNHMPVVQRLQEQFMKARMTGNPMETAKAAHELQDYMKRNKVNPLKNMMVPFAQLPIFISVFVGLRQMANLPVESMKTGGLLWLPDLTIPDPLYLLPVLTMATFLVTVEIGVDGMKTQTMGHGMKWFMRAMPVIMLPFIINFPTALCCYWFTSNIFSLSQVLFLKIPAVRNYFEIPAPVKHDAAAKQIKKKKGFVEGFRQNWDNSKLLAKVEERQRMDALKFKEAGSGPLQKTYSYDPTKVKKLEAKETKSS